MWRLGIMATLKTNTLTGTSTAGSIAVTGEGNSTTTNLQQGLCKAWARLNPNTLQDSLNTSGITDGGTGTFTYAYTNAMGNANYMVSAGGNSGEGNTGSCVTNNNASFNNSTTVCGIVHAAGNGTDSVDDPHTAYYSIHGDLA
jgi:hypothetical protein